MILRIPAITKLAGVENILIIGIRFGKIKNPATNPFNITHIITVFGIADFFEQLANHLRQSLGFSSTFKRLQLNDKYKPKSDKKLLPNIIG